MIFPKRKWGHEEWTSESPHLEYSEVFIFTSNLYYHYVCIVDNVRYWKSLSENILKLKEFFLLRSFHMTQVLYLTILLSLFQQQALVFDDYSSLFLIQEYLQYP